MKGTASAFWIAGTCSPAQPCISAIKGVPCNSWPSTGRTWYYRFNYDRIISPTLLSHLTVGLNRRAIIENPDNINNVPEDWRKAIQVPGTIIGGAPGLSTEYDTEFVNYSTRVHTDSHNRTTDLKEQMTWLKGKHSVKFGFEYLRSIYRRADCVGCAGQVSFSQAATQNPSVSGRNGSGYAAFLLGLAGVSNFNYSADIAFQWPYYGAYIQDDYKVSSKLTINIGLRYDLNIPKEERNHHNSNLNLGIPNSAAGGYPGAMQFAGINGAPNRFGETRLNAFGPRLGIAYQLTPKTMIRTGGAIYYQPTREDKNADSGIQGFGGWFYSPSDYLGTGISFRLRDGFNTFPNEVKANQPPDYRSCDPTVWNSFLRLAVRRTVAVLCGLELHHRARVQDELDGPPNVPFECGCEAARQVIDPESARPQVPDYLWKPSGPAPEQLARQSDNRGDAKHKRLQVAICRLSDESDTIAGAPSLPAIREHRRHGRGLEQRALDL